MTTIDFYTPYPPGVYYALAGLYRVAGVVTGAAPYFCVA